MYKYVVAIRTSVLVFLTHHLALPLISLLRPTEKFAYTREMLQQMPAGSLGRELVNMLDSKKLELLPHYARHDVKHILLQYDTTEAGEVCLQCFMLGNGHVSFPVMATVLFGVFTMPEYWARCWSAWQRGKRCASLENWQWVTLMDQPVQLLRQKINQPL